MKIEEIVGKRGVVRGDAAARYLGAKPPKRAEPAIVATTSAQEVADVLASTSRAGVPVFIAGSSSRGMRWDALPGGPSVVLDLAKMDAILAVDEVSMTVTTQTGITCAALERGLIKRGFTLGFALGGFAEQVSIGGLLATGLPPLASPARGTPADHVVNLGWVAPDGTPVRTRITPRSSTGPDLDALLLGGRGLLGVITEATLRIHRDPEEKLLLGHGFKTMADAVLTLAEVVAAGLPPTSAGIWPASPGAKRGARLAAQYGGSASWTKAMASSAKKAFKDLGARLDPKPDESWFAHVDAAALRVGGASEPIWAYGTWHALARAAASDALTTPEASFGIPTFDAHGGYAVCRLDAKGAVRALESAGCRILRGPDAALEPFAPAARALLTRLKKRLDPGNLLNPENA